MHLLTCKNMTKLCEDQDESCNPHVFQQTHGCTPESFTAVNF